jgi:hypothetical protein
MLKVCWPHFAFLNILLFKLTDVKVTLMDVYKYGFEQAVVERASPEDRPFVEALLTQNRMQAEMQQQSQQ